MNKKLFQNDSITGNSLIGFEIRGTFKKEEDELLLFILLRMMIPLPLRNTRVFAVPRSIPISFLNIANLLTNSSFANFRKVPLIGLIIA